MTQIPFQRVILMFGVAGILATAVLFSACTSEKPPATSQASETKSRIEAKAADEPTKNAAPAKSSATDVKKADAAARIWPMFGGAANRNMVNTLERSLPAEWDLKTKKNIKWVAALGSQSYGNPVVSGGKIFLGTNNGGLRNPRDARKTANAGDKPLPEDKGIVICFNEADGKFLWQAVHDKLAAGRVQDWPEQGVCSSPYVEGDRLYYVSNRCELICADVEGFANGNQGVQDEKYKEPTDADIIWRLDMIEELTVFPHNLAVCSPLVIGDLVFIVTGNGHDESHENIPSPKAPSFIAVEKKTGKLVWEDGSPGEKILHGQWSNPTYAEINGKPQVIFPGGDGWLYTFDPKTGKLIWKFDCNPKASKYVLGGRGTRNEIIATPVVYENKVYVAVGQDPEHGEGVGHLWCVDPAKATAENTDLSPVNDNFDPKADVNKKSGLVWHYGGLDDKKKMIFYRTISTCSVHDGLCYAATLNGFVYCFDAKTGQKVWEHDAISAIWGSPYWVDDKVYIGTDEGDVLVFQSGKEKKLLSKNNMNDEPTLSTPVAVNSVLYVMTRNHLYAIGNK